MKGGGWRVVEREKTLGCGCQSFCGCWLCWRVLGQVHFISSCLLCYYFTLLWMEWLCVHLLPKARRNKRQKKRAAPYFCCSNLLRVLLFYSAAHSCLHRSLWKLICPPFLTFFIWKMCFSPFSFQILPRRNEKWHNCMLGCQVSGARWSVRTLWDLANVTAKVCICVWCTSPHPDKNKESFSCQGDKTSCSLFILIW